jgi:hypothetical protein
MHTTLVWTQSTADCTHRWRVGYDAQLAAVSYSLQLFQHIQVSTDTWRDPIGNVVGTGRPRDAHARTRAGMLCGRTPRGA